MSDERHGSSIHDPNGPVGTRGLNLIIIQQMHKYQLLQGLHKKGMVVLEGMW